MALLSTELSGLNPVTAERDGDSRYHFITYRTQSDFHICAEPFDFARDEQSFLRRKSVPKEPPPDLG